MKKFSRLASVLVLLAIKCSAVDYYVSTSGSDSNSGSSSSPFATLTKARDAVRALKAKGFPSGDVNVYIKSGTYQQSSTLSFDSRDSGTSSTQVIWRAADSTSPVISGAKTLSASSFSLATSSTPNWSKIDSVARGHVYVANLKSAGITNYGTLRIRGYNNSQPGAMVLSSNGQPMTLARWPNIDQPLEIIAGENSSSSFKYSGDRPSRWTGESDVWLHGCFANPWTDFHQKVSSISTGSKLIYMTSSPGGFTPALAQPYYAYNILQELDSPGEYYIDRSSGLLYYWPQTGSIGSEDLDVSLLEADLVRINGASYITFQDVVFENSRTNLINATSASHIEINDCLLRGAGQNAVILSGTNNILTGSQILDTGEHGVIIQGGTRSSLSAGNNIVSNNQISRVGRTSWTFYPAIRLDEGVGNIARNNLIQDIPHTAIVFSGNNHTIELNEIRRAIEETSDAGVIYGGSDWGYRGNKIKNNFIHSIASSQDGYGAHGIYLDDCISGIEVTGNIVYNLSHSATIGGGGRDNVFKGNIFALCNIGHVNDDRGRIRINNTPGDHMNLLERLKADGIKYQSAPWSSSYPKCSAIPNSWSSVQSGVWRNPQGCTFSGNIGWKVARWTYESNTSGTGVFSLYSEFANNNSSHSAIISDSMEENRSSRPSSLTSSTSGFSSIPFKSIGLSTFDQRDQSSAPAIPSISTVHVSGVDAHVTWATGSLRKNKATSARVEYRSAPDGSWVTVGTYGEDTSAADVKDLAPNTSYEVRVVAINGKGSTNSAPRLFRTDPPALIEGTRTRLEAEKGFQIVSEAGSNGKISSSNAILDSGESLRIYDVGDTFRLSFSVSKAGLYKIAFRGTCGGAINFTANWPNGYKFKVDGTSRTFIGDLLSISAPDTSYGNCFWGTMYSEALNLSAGTHSVDVISNTAWAVADYVEIVPVSELLPKTFALWQDLHFSIAQVVLSAVSSLTSSASGDGVSNLVKYALGLDPWTKDSDAGVIPSVSSGKFQIEYTKSVYASDVTVTPEFSSDQKTWTAATPTTVNTTDGVATMRAVDPKTSTYARIKVSGSIGTGYSPTFTKSGASSGGSTTSSPSAQPSPSPTPTPTPTTSTPSGSGGSSTGTPMHLQRVEAETKFTIVKEAGSLGKVSVGDSEKDSGMSVRIYDSGDKVQIPLSVPSSGTYQLRIRVRCGGSDDNDGYWPNGYSFEVDGKAVTLKGDTSTISNMENGYGPTYWGTMLSSNMTLSSGNHTVNITSNKSWAVVDYVDVYQIQN